MLHPSYTDLINAVNNGVEENSDAPTINSRYSIVIAASRRARQIIDAKEKNGDDNCVKPLSVAVDEIHNGRVIIVSEDDIPEDEIDLNKDITEMYTEEDMLKAEETDENVESDAAETENVEETSAEEDME